MIVVAAVAISLWLRPTHWFGGSHWIRVLLNGDPTLAGIFSIQPLVAIGTLTLLILELRHFRPPLRRLARRPGFVACCAVVVVMLLVGSMSFQDLRTGLAPGKDPWVEFQYDLGHCLTFSHGQCGAAVAAAWLTLALNGRWRPRPDWLDRAGRALGLFWIALIPLVWLDAFLSS
jgi:hypothetical protein